MTAPTAPLRLLAGLLALYLVAPFAAGLAQMGTAAWTAADLPGLARAAGVSVASATLSTLLVAVGGVPLGYVLARGSGRGLALLGFAVQLPLALPPLASGVLLLFLLGYASPLGRLAHGALTDTFAGIVLAEAFVSAPFLIVAARQAFAAIDPLLEEVAATLGHRPGAVFRRVGFPLAWRGILAGLLLCWLRAFGEFGATVMVAYHPYSLPVFAYVAFGAAGLPAMLPVLLPMAAASVLVMAASQLALRPTKRRPVEHAALPPLAPPRPATSSRQGAPRLALAAHRRLDGFTLDVAWNADARRLAILGASGSGKSLTLRLIAGLCEASASQVRFGERDLGALPTQGRGIAYVPQGYGLLPHRDVASQIRFAVDCDPRQALFWTARLGLAGLEHRRPHELSLGQQQRVALARALSRRDAGLVLLDEPFSALDSGLRERLAQEMLSLQREMDATTVLVTHDPAEAMLLADELLLLDGGRVLQSGPVAALFARPASEAAARLLGARTIGSGRITDDARIDIGGGVRLDMAGPPLAAGLAVGWAVRPHQVRLSHAGGHAGHVLRREPARDGQRRVSVRLGGVELDILTDPGCPAEGPACVYIDPEALQVWPAGPARGNDP